MPRRRKPTTIDESTSSPADASPIDPIDWRALFRAADAVREMQPWKWMVDDQLFAVQDPASGELGICSIMGFAGLHFAVAVYRGAEGLAGFLQLSTADDDDDATEAYANQRVLQASFESREQLSPTDLRLIKSLGLKYRGANAWPMFRSQWPGYLPWYCTPDEARFLLAALNQVLEVAPRFRDAPDGPKPPRRGEILSRVLRGDVWEDRWMPLPKPVAPAPPMLPAMDELTLRRLDEKAGIPRQGVWEIDYVILGEGFQEQRGDRPCFGAMAWIVDAHSGLILRVETMDLADRARRMVSLVQQLLMAAPAAPLALHVRRQNLQGWLLQSTAALSIPVELRRHLPALAHARQAFSAFGV